jgi:hypothetical protein
MRNATEIFVYIEIYELEYDGDSLKLPRARRARGSGFQMLPAGRQPQAETASESRSRSPSLSLE